MRVYLAVDSAEMGRRLDRLQRFLREHPTFSLLVLRLPFIKPWLVQRLVSWIVDGAAIEVSTTMPVDEEGRSLQPDLTESDLKALRSRVEEYPGLGEEGSAKDSLGPYIR